MTRISIHPLIQNGNPCISGTRITVLDVVMYCEATSVAECVEAYDRLEREDVLTALRYCVGRTCDSDGEHCGGCVLRPIQDGIETVADYINRFEALKFLDSEDVLYGSGSGVMYVGGTIDELDVNWRGVRGWELAAKVLQDWG